METLLFACMKQYSRKQEVYLSVYLCEALFRLREYKQVGVCTKSLCNYSQNVVSVFYTK